MVGLLFLCRGHELPVDDPEEDVDDEEEEELPANQLVQRALPTRPTGSTHFYLTNQLNI